MSNPNNPQNPLRFDPREIAVIFSLFVFVSLLMFTVGILVGKGLAQARYESIVAAEAERIKLAARAPFSPQNVVGLSTGTSVSTPSSSTHSEVASADVTGAAKSDALTPVEASPAVPVKAEPRLELVPDGKTISIGGLKEPAENQEVAQVLANPQLRNIFEVEESSKRLPASVSAGLTSGRFTVQVGSYPSERDAADRVAALKKLGYVHAFFSAKEIREKNDTWFRVWLGHFPSEAQASLAGQSLRDRGEVKDYLVREADKASAKN